MDNFQLIVGSEACPIHPIVSIIGEDFIIPDHWSGFARELGIPSSKIKKLRKDILLDKIELSDAISEVIESWVTRSGSKATLQTLLGVLEDKCGSNAIGELLRLLFNLPCRRNNKALLEWKELGLGFQERVKQNLQHFFPKLDFSTVLPKLEGPLLDELMMGKKPPIFKETLPEKLSYYIHRTLITRHFISNKIFDDQSADIFLFTGMDRYELSKSAKDKLTSTTKEQLRGHDVTSKFIILDHANHFEKICKKTPNPVHLLRKESDGRFKWIRSNGKMSNFREHIDVSQNELDEVEFCKQVGEQSKAVIISDSPGMGKSTLLGEIGRNLATYPDRSVHFIVLSEFIALVRKLGKESTNLQEVITRALQNSICLNVLGKVVLPQEMNSENPITMELLLDGLDEVRSSDSEFALEVLRAIRDSFKSVRFWVTSRPHLLQKLEDNLSLLGYNIRSFSQDNQVQFLSSYWQRSPSVPIDQNRSVKFAEHCLLSLNSTLTSSDEDIAGVPLQCLLIGHIYEEEAMDYAGQDNEPLASIEVEVGTVANLYRLLVQKKFRKYVTAYPGTRLDIPDLMAIHVRLSLQLLFPESVAILEEITAPGVDDNMQLTEVLNVGILELSSTAVSPRFLHRTFAEYFVAWFVLGKFRNERVWKVELSDFIFKTVMKSYPLPIIDPINGMLMYSEFYQPVLCYFLNSFISEVNIKTFPTLSSTEPLSFDILRGISVASIKNQFDKLFIWLDDFQVFGDHSQKLFDFQFLLYTLEWSTLDVLRRVLIHFDQNHNLNLELQAQILRTAAHWNQFSIFEFLLKDRGLRGIVGEMKDGTRELLHDCVSDSDGCSSKEIEEKVLILRMLVEINPSLLEAEIETGETPLLCGNVTVLLLKELLLLGANVLAQDMNNYTVIHSPSLSPEDYHSLLISIPEDKLRKLVHVKWGDSYTPLTSLLRGFEPLPDTLQILHAVGADFNVVDDKGHSVLAVAVKHGRNSETIRALVNLGASLNWRGMAKGETLLHLAAKYGNVKVAEIFIQEWKIGANVKDEDGLTPLDYTIRSEKVNGNRLETGLTLIKQGVTFKEDTSPDNPPLLHTAVKSLNSDSVRLLLHLGVDANALDTQGNTPLHLLAEKNDRVSMTTTLIEHLLEHGADPRVVNKNGETPFHIALRDMPLDRFDLLKSKTEVPWSTSLANVALNLMTRCKIRLDEDKLAYFIHEFENHGIDVNFVNEGGDSLLHIAVTNVNFGSVAVLLNRHANPNLKNKLGRTSLHMAALLHDNKHCLSMIMMLIKEGADTYARDNRSVSFIQYYICGAPAPSDFHLLLEYLVSCGHADILGSTAVVHDFKRANLLHQAVQFLEPEERTLSLLQSHNADFNSVDKFGASVLIYAIYSQRRAEFLNTLVNKFGVKWEVYRSSLLHMSGQYGTLDCLRFFLDLGGLDVNGMTRDCRDTPLHSVIQQAGEEHILEKCKLLIERGANVIAINKNGQSPRMVLEERLNENHEDPLPEDTLPSLQLKDGEVDELIQLLSPSLQTIRLRKSQLLNRCFKMLKEDVGKYNVSDFYK